MRKILFSHGRAPGDCLMLSAGVRDFKALFPEIAINVKTQFPDIFENNPNLDRSIVQGGPGVEFYQVGYPQIQGCNSGSIHFTQCFLLDMITHADAHEKLPLTLGDFAASWSGGGDKELGEGEKAREPFKSWRKRYREFTKSVYRQYGDIHLTEEEKRTNPIRDLYGLDRYWVVAPGGKRDCTCKIWDWRKFQKVVDYFDGYIKFVTVGRSDHLVDRLRGVIDFTDKTPRLRDLFPIFYNATGVVSGVSFPMHLAAAMPSNPILGSIKSRKPCVAIYGGREPVSFTAYCNHQVLHTNGALTCCDNGGCWQSRVVPIAKDPESNNRLCHNTVEADGRTVQKCMDMISVEDVIRAIERYHDGGLYSYAKQSKNTRKIQKSSPPAPLPQGEGRSVERGREINVLASLQSEGGGEQSVCKIVEVLRGAGWKVHFYPWGKVAGRFAGAGVEPYSFASGMVDHMKAGLPLLFYANDQINDFCDQGKTGTLIEKSSGVAVGINFMNGALPKSTWLAASRKVRGVIFQNTEKVAEFERDAMGFENTALIPLFGAIDLEKFYQLEQARRPEGGPLVVLKHCTADYRKYVTAQSENNGQKIHQWQKDFVKENDVKFYTRLLAECKFDIRFEFMEAHKELVEAFADEPRMVFHKWNAMDVGEFLKRGHVYLYRTSNLWRDQYPRCVAEALAAGLPILTEPRDGTRDRVIHGDTGIHCLHYEDYREWLKTFHRKENYRFNLGRNAKEWAKVNLDPRRWVDVLEGVLF